MSDDIRKDEPDGAYEAPKVDDLESENGPSVTAAGESPS